MSVVKKVEKDAVIFREGDVEQCMYRVVAGRVGVYSGYGSQNQKLLTELEKDQFFGEMGLIDYMRRSATVVALEETELEVIGDAEFTEYLSQNSEESLKLLGEIAARIRELTKDYAQVCRDLSAYAAQDGLNVEPSLLDRLLRFAGFGRKMSSK